MADLNEKLNEVFPGRVVRKDLARLVSGNAAVPNYVLEYLLGQYCASDNELEIEKGVQRVKDILAENYVRREEAGLIRSRIRERGRQTVIDKVSVSLNEKRDAYEAKFENLGIENVLVSSETVRKNERLLVSGVWCIAGLTYAANEAKDESPYLLEKLNPIQLSHFDFDQYLVGRNQFTFEEWLDVIIRSIGLDPEQLGRRAKLFQVTRLVAYCERNYNFVELGPKGTGKSHVFSEFSPHGTLISGGETTPAKLFVNNSNGKIGLVGFYDCVCFDEFAGKNKRPKADIVDIMKNYMANKSFSRGIDQVNATASMAFVGNTSHDVSYMIKKTDLLEDLPILYRDTAFIDRFHAYVPGWEMDIIRGEMFSKDFGFIVDYLAEAFRHMLALDYSGEVLKYFELSASLSTRDRDGILKTCAGLIKILFPCKDATEKEASEIVEFAMEMRKRVKDTLIRMDETFERPEFSYRLKEGGDWIKVQTLEELDYPLFYHALDKIPYKEINASTVNSPDNAVAAYEEVVRDEDGLSEAMEVPSSTTETVVVDKTLDRASDDEATSGGNEIASAIAGESVAARADKVVDADATQAKQLFEGHKAFRENGLNVSYESLFGVYLDGVNNIEIVDPYIRAFHQCRNLVEFLECAYSHFWWDAPSLNVHLITGPDDYDIEKQRSYLDEIAEMFQLRGVDFTYEIKMSGIHARHIKIDDRWDIGLDRGLDIFQKWDDRNQFSSENRMQELRRTKDFELDYRKLS